MTFFFDTCIARPLAQGIGVIFGAEVRTLEAEFGGTDIQDMTWMPIIAGKQWIVLTGDDRIRKKRSERALLKSLGLRVVFIAPGFLRLAYAVQASKLVAWWPEIVKQCHSLELGVCLLCSMQGKLERVEKL